MLISWGQLCGAQAGPGLALALALPWGVAGSLSGCFPLVAAAPGVPSPTMVAWAAGQSSRHSA